MVTLKNQRDESVIFVCFSPVFYTEGIEQKLYQILQHSPTELRKHIPGIGQESVSGMVNTHIMPIRYKDSRFPEIRLLQIITQNNDMMLVKICTQQHYEESLRELTEEKTEPTEVRTSRKVLMVIAKVSFSQKPIHKAIEISTVSPEDVDSKFHLLWEIFQDKTRMNLGFAIRTFLFPYGTFLATVIAFVGGVVVLWKGFSQAPAVLIAAVILSSVFLLPRLCVTIGVLIHSRFKQWCPRGTPGGATIREQEEPEEMRVSIEKCPICSDSHILNVSLRRWSVQFRFVPHWLDPFAPSVISSPQKIHVRLVCPKFRKPFQSRITIRQNTTQVIKQVTPSSQ